MMMWTNRMWDKHHHQRWDSTKESVVRCPFQSKGNDSSKNLHFLLEKMFSLSWQGSWIWKLQISLFFYFLLFLILISEIPNWLLMRSKYQKSSGCIYSSLFTIHKKKNYYSITFGAFIVLDQLNSQLFLKNDQATD